MSVFLNGKESGFYQFFKVIFNCLDRQFIF